MYLQVELTEVKPHLMQIEPSSSKKDNFTGNQHALFISLKEHAYKQKLQAPMVVRVRFQTTSYCLNLKQ